MNAATRGLLCGLAICCLSSSAPARPPASALPFVRDDYARALAEARARKIPIFIEAWAPW
jgi:hypothetical protein